MSSQYDVVINSYGISSVLVSSYLSERGLKVFLVDKNPIRVIKAKDFTLYPYEIPLLGLNAKEYSSDLMSFFGLSGFNKLLKSEDESIGIVFRDIKIDFKLPYIKEDVRRQFGQEELVKLSKLIDEIKSRSEKSFIGGIRHKMSYNGINKLYKKYDIDVKLTGVINALLFVLTGVASRNYKLTEASRVLTLALSGIGITESNSYSIRHSLLNIHRPNVDTGNGEDLKNLIQIPLTIDDTDSIKVDFIDNFERFKGQHSDGVMYPLSLYVKLSSEFISTAMPQFVVFVDADRSDYFEFGDVYVIRSWTTGDKTDIRVTSFVPFGLFDVDSEQHKSKIKKMRNIMESLIPNLKIDRAEYYADLDFANLSYGDIVYDESILGKVNAEKKDSFLCGREQRALSGFEGSVISGIDVAQKILRKMKK